LLVNKPPNMRGAYTIEKWDKNIVEDERKRRGLKSMPQRGIGRLLRLMFE
jgi:hypothetical protein